MYDWDFVPLLLFYKKKKLRLLEKKTMLQLKKDNESSEVISWQAPLSTWRMTNEKSEL